jgi:hypothetical protein
VFGLDLVDTVIALLVIALLLLSALVAVATWALDLRSALRVARDHIERLEDLAPRGAGERRTGGRAQWQL